MYREKKRDIFSDLFCSIRMSICLTWVRLRCPDFYIALFITRRPSVIFAYSYIGRKNWLHFWYLSDLVSAQIFSLVAYNLNNRRITKQLRSEGTSEGHLTQPPCSRGNTHNRLLRTMNHLHIQNIA